MDFSNLKGETLVSISGSVGEQEMTFVTKSGKVYRMFHDQDCCERVQIEDICGDPRDLIGSPILLSECVSNREDLPGHIPGDDSHTWTFYKLATNLGSITIRWLGESNGYYSESVDFEEVILKSDSLEGEFFNRGEKL